MKGLYTVVFLISATAAIDFSCHKIQDVGYETERLLPHRECNKFYQCTHGEAVEMSCPMGLFYNIIERKCDWRDNVECGERIYLDNLKVEVKNLTETVQAPNDKENSTFEVIEIVKPDSPITVFLPNGCPVDREVHWLLPHETFCNLFYYCVWGVKELSRCPFWLHFNIKLQICDWPRNAGCLESEIAAEHMKRK